MDFDHSLDTITPDNQPTITFGGTSGITLSGGTTGQRPTAVVGIMRYNGTTDAIEVVNTGNTWRTVQSTANMVTTSITAAGTTQATATSISSLVNVITTAAAGSGVILPSATPGDVFYIVNGSSNSILVYPPVGGAIASLSTNTGFTQNANSSLTLIAQSASRYQLTSYAGPSVATVSSVDVSGGTTGLTTSGGPITTSGTITLAGTLSVPNGGTGLTTAPANGALLIGNGTNYTSATITQGTGMTITNGAGTITVANAGVTSITGTANQVTASASTGGVTLSLPQSISTTSNVTFGAVTGTSYTVGTLGFVDTNVLASFQSSVNSYNQLVIQNTSSGTTASADLVVTNNSATATTHYGNFGINSSGFTGSGALNAANNIYLTGTTGDLAIGTTTSNGIHFVVNNGATDAFAIGTSGQWLIGSSAGTTNYVFTSAGASAAPTWTNPTTLVPPGGSTTQIQYNSSGAFAGSANLTYGTITNTLGLSGTAPRVQITAHDNVTEPGASSSGTIYMYAKDIATRLAPKWVGPFGIDAVVQRAHAYSSFYLIRPNGAAGMASVGLATTLVGTISTPQPTSTNYKSSVSRTLFTAAATTAGTLVSLRCSGGPIWRGNAAGLGGFEFVIRFGLDTLATGNRAFFGLADVISAPTNIDPLSSTTPGKIGMGISTDTGNWSIVSNASGSATTTVALGASFPVNTTSQYELVLFCAPNSTSMGYRVTNLSTGNATSGTIAAAALPSSATFLAPWCFMTNNTTAATFAMNIGQIYMETDA